MIRQLLCFVLFAILLASNSVADEIRPGYLELRETDTNLFSVVWKVPAKGDKKLKMEALLPVTCPEMSPPVAQFSSGAYIQRWIVNCEEGLVGQQISIAGLQYTSTDVLLRIEFLDSSSQSVRLTPAEHSFIVPAAPSSMQIVGTYMWLGVEHILLGVDHLLFVFALLLIVNGVRRLVWTITAFTVAHSITLAGATLGFVNVPQQPVEAIIALSILFLATEIARTRLRRAVPSVASSYCEARSNEAISDAEKRLPRLSARNDAGDIREEKGRLNLSLRWPWIVAFSFGLLHGFGFAGALAEVGLPQQAIPLALVFFNVGVELGQLAFVGMVLVLGWAVHRIRVLPLLPAKIVITYTIGSVAAFWTIERVAGFWG